MSVNINTNSPTYGVFTLRPAFFWNPCSNISWSRPTRNTAHICFCRTTGKPNHPLCAHAGTIGYSSGLSVFSRNWLQKPTAWPFLPSPPENPVDSTKIEPGQAVVIDRHPPSIMNLLNVSHKALSGKFGLIYYLRKGDVCSSLSAGRDSKQLITKDLRHLIVQVTVEDNYQATRSGSQRRTDQSGDKQAEMSQASGGRSPSPRR